MQNMRRKMKTLAPMVRFAVMISLTFRGSVMQRHLSKVMNAVMRLVIRAKHPCGQPAEYRST